MSINAVSGGATTFSADVSSSAHDDAQATESGGNLMRQRRDLGVQTASDARNMLLHPDNPEYQKAYQQDMKNMRELGQTMSTHEKHVLTHGANSTGH